MSSSFHLRNFFSARNHARTSNAPLNAPLNAPRVLTHPPTTRGPIQDLGASCNAPAADDDAAVVGVCADNTHGPPCSADSDCDGVTDCARCAGSGYCTDVLLAF